MICQPHRHVLVLFCLSLIACDGSPQQANQRQEPTRSEVSDLSLILPSEAARRIGVETTVLPATSYQPVVPANAVVLDPGPLFANLADLSVATAAEQFGARNVQRLRTLVQDEGNVAQQDLEQAETQYQQDSFKRNAVSQQLRSQWGERLLGADAETIAKQLATGRLALMRIDVLQTAQPDWSSAKVQFAGELGNCLVHSAWRAPIASPARRSDSWYVLIHGTCQWAINTRAQIEIPIAQTIVLGVVIPRSAVIYADGAPWVFVARSENAYERRKVSIDRPAQDGYFDDHVVLAGERVVSQGAGLLLAAQIGADQDED